MVNVNTFKLYYEFLALKNDKGNTMTPSQFNINCFQAMMIPYSKDYETFVQTKVVSNYLQNFLKTNYVQQVNPINPIVPYPSDFQFLSSAGTYYEQTQIDATLVDNVDWREMLRPNSLNYPTLRFPKYQQIGAGIIFAPNNVGTSYLDYFATPIQPVWAFTTVNNRKVYDAANSVNLDIDAFATNMVMGYFLQMVGINLGDDQLSGFAQMFTKETNLAL